jgi:3-oxoacyl-[acyl-carrier-protein] synthase I
VSLVVTAAGMMSSVGDLVTACAAARAGITRRGPLGPRLPIPGSEDPAEVKGHACSAVAGAEERGRLAALAALAVRDALAPLPSPWIDAQTPVWLLVPDAADRPALEQLDDSEEEPANGADAFFADRLRTLAAPQLAGAQVHLVCGRHDAFIGLVSQLEELFARRACDRALVCAVDSAVEEANLARLVGEGRLRHDDSPVGFFPGEVAAAFVLESEESAHRRRAPALARLGPAAHRPASPAVADVAPPVREGAAAEEEPPASPGPRGTLLASAIAQLGEHSPGAIASVAALMDDFNGESERIRHLWTNLLRLGPAYGHLRQAPRWSPAEVFGDVGAATGALHVCVALRAFARRYAPGPSFLVCNTGEDGAAGAMIVSSPG